MPNLHPMVIHFPIALIFVVITCDLIGILTSRRLFIQTGTIVSIFASLGAIVAVISGSIAEESVENIRGIHDMLESHETAGFIFLGLVVVLAIFRLAVGDKLYDRFKWVGFVIALAAGGVVSYGGYLGGEMVFTHGAGVKAVEISGTSADTQFESQDTKDKKQASEIEHGSEDEGEDK